ncbi:hypothetical protein [Lutimonas zeaxanthinifaciens]|uniref:hypothetical protein n=1 Tax=Lutimonas zeaxanthinifaciens TaxID=3060215 RepID=UPI00265D1C53|nr:hypothetical protein [Lutimonas sp. YSD2104]WKK64617.1 hypothetical protein QZH61_08435 [Lutimonas sp. YSD2104]
MSETKNKNPKGFWIIGIVALLWNLMGVAEYLQLAYMKEETLAAMPVEQQALYENVPAWVTGAFALAVFGGLLGCILLLMKKKLATVVFIISLISVLAQMSYSIFMTNAMEVMGAMAIFMPILVIVISIFLVWYSRKMESEGVLT